MKNSIGVLKKLELSYGSDPTYERKINHFLCQPFFISGIKYLTSITQWRRCLFGFTVLETLVDSCPAPMQKQHGRGHCGEKELNTWWPGRREEREEQE